MAAVFSGRAAVFLPAIPLMKGYNGRRFGQGARRAGEARGHLAGRRLFFRDQKYSAVAQKLEPILSRAVAAAKPGRERADLRARVGWAYFLESRDGTSDVDPTGSFRDAASEDPNNPYAEAMWGYSVIWNHCYRMKEAASHFAAAIASQREGDFVRRLQLYALLGCNIEEADQEVIHVANAMRKEQRMIDDWERGHILSLYYLA